MMIQSDKPHLLMIVKVLVLSFFIFLSNGQTQCQLNPSCFDGCSDSTCVYDPSTNPFYNSSLSNDTVAYKGPFCCLGCNSGYFLWKDLKTCSETCDIEGGVQTFGNPLTRICEFACPSPYLEDPTSTKCVAKCPVDYWVNLNINRCVSYCPDILAFYYTPSRTCISACQDGNFTYIGSDNHRYCAPQCPDSLFAYTDNMACVSVCPNILYADNFTGKCVLDCPQPTFKHRDTKRCQSKCFGKYPYGDEISGFCVQECLFDQLSQRPFFGENKSALCVQVCPSESYGHEQVLICVQQCFGNYSVPNSASHICEMETFLISELSTTKLVIILSVSSGSILIFALISMLVYKLCSKKKVVRKPWKYDYFRDIQFSL